MDISFFRSRRPGPELMLEDAVFNWVDQLSPLADLPSWVACSPSIGAGMPDILFAHYKPQVFALSKKKVSNTQLLAFLRGVNGARLDTIMYHLKYPEKIIATDLDELVTINAVHQSDDVFFLSQLWKNIIPTIITIEVKVHDWRKAVAQAARNKIFSHQSYVALPKRLAIRIKDYPVFTNLGIGLLSIDDTDDYVHEEISALVNEPQIWEYYYKLAILLANSRQDDQQCHSLYL
jgi:hypothetical protein